jgi:hypothetical protein
MVDVIQVPSVPEIPMIVYALVAWLVSMVTSLTFMMVYMFKKERSGLFGSSNSLDTLLLISLLTGKYDVFQKLLAYQMVGKKTEIRKKMLEVMSAGAPVVDGNLPLDTNALSNEFLTTSVDNIKKQVMDEIKDELRDDIKRAIKLEISRNLYRKHKIKL